MFKDAYFENLNLKQEDECTFFQGGQEMFLVGGATSWNLAPTKPLFERNGAGGGAVAMSVKVWEREA
jgi:hypothetical protein